MELGKKMVGWILLIAAVCHLDVVCAQGPEGVHIALGSNPYVDRTIMWTTMSPNSHNITLRKLDSRKPLPGINVTHTLMNGTYEKHWVQRAVYEGLEEKTMYEYTVGDDSNVAAKKTFRFQTWSHKTSIWPTEFLLYSGSVNSPAHVQLLRQTQLDMYSAMLNLGSWSCDEGKNNMKETLENLESFAGSSPFLTTTSRIDAKNGFGLYSQIFSMPNAEWPSYNQLWYSFDTDYAHLVSFSTEVYFTNSETKLASKQLNWLKKDLRDFNKKKRNSKLSWIIAYAHRPIYCSGSQECAKTSKKFKELANLFYSEGVDLVIGSQQGYYERTHPIGKDGKPTGTDTNNPRGPIYISTASFSCEGSNTVKPGVRLAWTNVVKPVAKSEPSSYGRLQIYNATYLAFEERIADNHTVIDKLVINQKMHGPFTHGEKYNPTVVIIISILVALLICLVIFLIVRRKMMEIIERKRAKARAQIYINLPDGAL